MQHRHLSDDEIQSLLETGDPDRLIGGCPACRAAFERYRLLTSQLEKDPGFTLAAGFAESTAAIYKRRRRILSWDTAALFVSLTVAIAMAVWALDVRSLWQSVTSVKWAAPDFTPLLSFFSGNSVIGRYAVKFALPAGLALLFCLTLDKILRRKGPSHFYL